MFKLRVRPKARNALDKIWERTSTNWGLTQATNYLEMIKHNLELIASNPHIGRLRERTRPELHVFAVGKHMICYLVDDSQIDVLRVLHRRMDVDSHVF